VPGPSTSPLDGVMGFTVYASCYVKRESTRAPAALQAIRRLARRSLFIPGAEPIFGNFEKLEILEPVAGFDKAAWLFSKVQFALNPPLAELIFIARLRSIARRFGGDVYVQLNDDGGIIGDAQRIHLLDLLGRATVGLLTSPVWLIVFIRRLLV
jgi:hypothetical protein